MENKSVKLSSLDHTLIILLLPRVRTCAAGGKAIGLSVVCRLSSVSIKIGKSQQLGQSRLNKWDKMV